MPWDGSGGVSGQKTFVLGKIRFESYIIRTISQKSKSQIFTFSWPFGGGFNPSNAGRSSMMTITHIALLLRLWHYCSPRPPLPDFLPEITKSPQTNESWCDLTWVVLSISHSLSVLSLVQTKVGFGNPCGAGEVAWSLLRVTTYLGDSLVPLVCSPKLLPQHANIFTRIYPSYPWHFPTLSEEWVFP